MNEVFSKLLNHIYLIFNIPLFNIAATSSFSSGLKQSETKLYNGSDKDVSASGGKLTKKESLKVKDLVSLI